MVQAASPSPFDGLQGIARKVFTVTRGVESWIVTCRKCSAAWMIPLTQPEPFQVVRPFWHVFEQHHQTF